MCSVALVCAQWQTLLTTTADDVAIRSGCVRRQRKLSGASLAQALLFGWLANPQATLEEVAQMAQRGGVQISPQGLEQRFTPAAATFLRQLLERAVAQALVPAGPAAAVPLLQRFVEVDVLDSTVVSLPAALADCWAGCGGGHQPGQGTAAVKVQLMLDLLGGRLRGPELQAGRAQDRAAQLAHTGLPAGALRLADLGYFDLETLATYSAQGVWWLSRLRAGTVVRLEPEAAPLVLRQCLPQWAPQPGDGADFPVMLGERRVAARLLVERVPPEVAAARREALEKEARRQGQPVSQERLALADWTLLVTNAPATLLRREEAFVLAAARWQIELFFKLWKGAGALATWRSTKPWRILCEFYAKLLGLLFQHTLLVLSCWQAPDRSLPKAMRTIRLEIGHLASVFAHHALLVAAVTTVQRCLALGCRITKRRGKPATYQRLLCACPAGLT